MTTTLRALTYLAPNLRPVYAAVLDWAGRALGVSITLEESENYADAPYADLSFICGLPYVLAHEELDALAAPVLQGDRFEDRPIYFSDIVVRHDHPARSFDDLRGASWAYNEPLSQSGCGVVCAALVKRGETAAYLGQVVQAGFHQRALRLVAAGEVDATAIDAQVLAVEAREHPDLAAQVRVIDTLGPSPIQPLAASRRVPESLKRDLRAALSTLHEDAAMRPLLDFGFIARFEAVTDADYDPIRLERAACERAGVTRLD